MKPPMMFHDCASVAKQQRVDAVLDEHGIIEQRHGGEQRRRERATIHTHRCITAALSARAGRSTRIRTSRPKLIDVGIGRAEIERGERLGDADGKAGEDHREGIVQSADDGDHERLRR